MRGMVALLFAPWWVFLILAGGIFWLAEEMYKDELQTQAERKQALAGPPPPLTDLSDFTRATGIGPANEVNISGWINPDYNFHLTKQLKRSSDERFMYVLFGKSDGPETKQARAVILMREERKESFVAELQSYTDLAASLAHGHAYMKFNGYGQQSVYMDGLVDKAFKKRGLTKSPDFIFVEPFWNGREAALGKEMDPEGTRIFLWQVAGVLVLLGVLKLIARMTRRKPKADLFDAGPIASAGKKPVAPVRAAPQMTARTTAQPSQAARPGSPIDRIRQRDLDRLTQADEMAHESSKPARPLPKSQGLGSRLMGLSGQSKMVLAAIVGVAVMIVVNPLLTSALLPVGMMIAFWWFVGRKVNQGVRGLLSELGIGQKPNLKMSQDPFSRLGH